MAVCLLESECDDDDETDVEAKKNRRLESIEAAAKLMVRVPDLKQKIAGKSIPLEVRVTLFPCRTQKKISSSIPLRNSSHAKPANSNPKTNTSLSPLSN